MSEVSDMSTRVNAFLAEYAWLLDGDRYEDWIELFAEGGRYEVIPMENYSRGMSIALMACDNKAMLRDRVRAYREANQYNLHRDRHVVGPAHVIEAEGGEVLFEASFMVVQSDYEGNGKLFTAGFYRTRLKAVGDKLKIVQKTVVLDVFNIPSMLASPI